MGTVQHLHGSWTHQSITSLKTDDQSTSFLKLDESSGHASRWVHLLTPHHSDTCIQFPTCRRIMGAVRFFTTTSPIFPIHEEDKSDVELVASRANSCFAALCLSHVKRNLSFSIFFFLIRLYFSSTLTVLTQIHKT